ncbi:hypothetical protein [Vulgatibacter sp.]|uniref:hypothetical protein n=1 Tax=Vulgatibacter sp. TaxID=1971226 RepID=UPI003561B950
MSRLISSLCAALAALAIAFPVAARAEDWANSLYTEGGIELRADERVFTLFAALNEMGLDDAPISRKDPIPKREYDPVRQQVRDAVTLDPALRGKFEAFFDKNPAPLRTYTAYALAVGPAPTFAAPEKLPKELAALKGFEALLAEFYGKASIQKIFDAVQPAHREALKRYTAVVDKPIASARDILKAPETDDSPRVVLVLNLLDGRGSSYGVGTADETWLVVGPAGSTPDAQAIVKAFARVEIQGAAEAGDKSLKGGSQLLREIQEAGYAVGAGNVADYVAETLARAVAIKAVVADGETSRAFEAEKRRGFVLVSDMNRGLAIYAKSPKPMNTFLADFLREVDAGKAVAALRGN